MPRLPHVAALLLASGCTGLNGAYDPDGEGDGGTKGADDSVTPGEGTQTSGTGSAAGTNSTTGTSRDADDSRGLTSGTTTGERVTSDTGPSDMGSPCMADGRPVFTIEDAFLVHGPACMGGCDGLNFGSTPEYDLYDLGSDAAAVLLLRFDSLEPDADDYILHVRSTVAVNALSEGDTLEVLGLLSTCAWTEGFVDGGSPSRGDVTWNHCAFPLTWPGGDITGAELVSVGTADLWEQHSLDPLLTEFVVELDPDALEPFIAEGGNTLLLRSSSTTGAEFSAREGEGPAWIIPSCD